MYDIYAYFDFDIGYFIVATKIIDSRYLTSVLAAAYGSFGLSDGAFMIWCKAEVCGDVNCLCLLALLAWVALMQDVTLFSNSFK